MELLLLLSIAGLGLATATALSEDNPQVYEDEGPEDVDDPDIPDDPAEPNDPTVTDEPDDPVELTGERNLDETLTGGSGNDTLTGNRNDTDVLIGGAGDDQIYLEIENSATGGDGADRFHVDLSSYDWRDPELIRITDFDPAEDQLLIAGGTPSLQFVQLPDGGGMGLADDAGQLLVEMPGVTELLDDSVIFVSELRDQASGVSRIEFEMQTTNADRVQIDAPQEGEPYTFVLAGDGDNEIQVRSDASIVRGGAGDDVISVIGDGETSLPDARVSPDPGTDYQRGFLESQDMVLHHNLYGDAGNDTITYAAPESFAHVRTIGDGEADLVRIEASSGADVYSGEGDTVVATAGAENVTVLMYGNGGLIDGSANSNRMQAWAEGDNTVNGGSADDRLYGAEGSQSISGGAGDDYIDGNETYCRVGNHTARVSDFIDNDADTLDGGAGDDEIKLASGDVATGGDGTDIFRVVADKDHDLGHATITDFNPDTEVAVVWLTQGEFTSEGDLPNGPSYDLRGRVSVTEAEDGTSSVRVDDTEVLRLENATGLSVGFKYTDENTGDEFWYDLDGNVVERTSLNVRLSVYHNYSDDGYYRFG